MKEYFVMLLTFLKISIKKVKHGKDFAAANVQRIGPHTSFITQRGALVSMGHNNCISRNGTVYVGKQGRFSLGSRVYFNVNAYISCQQSIAIGDNCIFGPNVTVIDNNHAFSKENGVSTSALKCGEISIGRNSWIGANAVILKNTSIGKNCVIGAGCVISGVIPEGSVVTQDRTLTVKEMQ